MACDTELSSVEKNRADAEVSYCALCIVSICFLGLVLRHFFSILVDVLSNATIGGTTKYVLMGFIFLLLTISSDTGASSESDK